MTRSRRYPGEDLSPPHLLEKVVRMSVRPHTDVDSSPKVTTKIVHERTVTGEYRGRVGH